MLSVARRIGAAATQSEFMTPGAAISHAVEEVQTAATLFDAERESLDIAPSGTNVPPTLAELELAFESSDATLCEVTLSPLGFRLGERVGGTAFAFAKRVSDRVVT